MKARPRHLRLLATALTAATGIPSAAQLPPPTATRTGPLLPPRVAVRVSGDTRELTPLSYQGGFQAKTLVYETLVRRGANGEIVPALAESWTIEEGGRIFRFRIREGARFHDGQPVDAESVRIHFRRWVGLPEHAWLGANERIRDVVVESESALRVELDEPYPLLGDLCAVNPCAIQGPGALDREGRFVHPVGSGPFELLESEDDDVLRFRRRGAEPGRSTDLELVPFAAGDGYLALRALLNGTVDLIVDGWYELVPREVVARLSTYEGIDVFDGPGSSVWYLSFCLEGPTSDTALRRAVAGAIDRAELIEHVEHGHADPARGWGAPTVRIWPTANGHPGPDAVPELERALRLLVRTGSAREQEIARALESQLEGAGIPLEVLDADGDDYAAVIDAGSFDLRIERTWGAPYDPFVSLRARFLPPPEAPSAATLRARGADPRLTALVERVCRDPDERNHGPLFTEIQALMDSEALLVPLFVPRRLGLVRSGRVDPVRLDHDIYRTSLSELVER